MDFEQYLEKDILTFLDSKTEKKESKSIDREEDYGIYMTRDYLKELNYALDNDELTKAKKLFDELKINYSRLPKSSIERKKIYSLLEKMYDKIQNYVKIKEGKIEIIRLGDSEIQKDKTDDFENAADKPTKIETSDNTRDRSEIKSEISSVKTSSMPIRADTFSESETKEKLFEHKKRLKTEKDSSVESNITESSIKENEKKYYEDQSKKSTEDDMSGQNIFVKEKEKKDIGNNQARRSRSEHIRHEDHGQEDIEPKQSKHIHPPHITINAQENGQEYDMQPKSYHVISNVPHNDGQKDHRHKTSGSIRQNVGQHENHEAFFQLSSELKNLKTDISQKLLEELYKKIDEEKDIQNKKIESLRSEIINKMIEEFDKRFTDQKHEESKNIEHMRSEILDQVYRSAQQAITATDNKENVSVEHYHIESPTVDIPSVERSDVIRFMRTEPLQSSNDAYSENSDSYQEGDTSEDNKNKYSGDELRIVYEQAVYYMFDSKYHDAAMLFKKIIEAQPANKAARIRLQECIEKQPELEENTATLENDAIDEVLSKNSVHMESAESFSKNSEINFNEDSDNPLHPLQNSEDGLENNSDETDIDNTVKDDKNDRVLNPKIFHKYKEEEMQKLYEQAIYTMFQNNYSDASKMFKQILRIRPDNKAARIRLQECMEAMGNA